ncbi:putative membrane protein insertion efficiency factor [Paraoerskovia sediminicola]|uniref:Putative membrane protein insertion efficiency factor n=1 Tax=Paraoerskovia sediminicola TaxID=1138587 RepID=A0ABN6XB42_9CELL|nr:membrane protein insertion efficiency factor YidD [Paraoerskovia sediminicola]BDZ42064.1 putative membrane protein insertion efficiency factor [Paraoerskovia sediminicola]
MERVQESASTQSIRGLRRAPARVLIALVRLYQRWISPLTPPTCKYYPSCSQYAVTAVGRHGVVRGSGLAIWRLLRCNPWSDGGVDDVPERAKVHEGDVTSTRTSARGDAVGQHVTEA